MQSGPFQTSNGVVWEKINGEKPLSISVKKLHRRCLKGARNAPLLNFCSKFGDVFFFFCFFMLICSATEDVGPEIFCTTNWLKKLILTT